MGHDFVAQVASSRPPGPSWSNGAVRGLVFGFWPTRTSDPFWGLAWDRGGHSFEGTSDRFQGWAIVFSRLQVALQSEAGVRWMPPRNDTRRCTNLVRPVDFT